MAIFNEILVGRFNRFFQKYTGIKANAPVPALSSEVMPTINIPYGVEQRILEGWEIFGTFQAAAAVAAQNSACRLRNPANSGVIAVLEKVSQLGQNSGGLSLQFGTIGADLTPSSGGPRDLRSRPLPTLIGSSGNNASAFGTVLTQTALTAFGLNQDLILKWDEEIVLTPGSGIQLITGNPNVPLGVAFWWRERPLEESEKTF